MIQELSSRTTLKGGHPLLRTEKEQDSSEAKRTVLLVLVTSDRGLCGGFNSSVIKACQRWIQANARDGVAVELACVGRRGHDFFKTKKVKITGYYSEAGGKVSFAKAKQLSKTLEARFVGGEIDEVKFIYNEFKNAMTQKVVVEDFLPLKKPDEALKESSSTEVSAGDSAKERRFLDYIVKPSPEEVLVDLLEKNFAIQTFRVLLESQAGEHGARMSAMENATKNAGEMIKKLTLLYNKQRQASITKELLEIISGSESQKA